MLGYYQALRAPSGANPKALGTLLVWYDAQQQGGSDGVATALTDKSGNGNNSAIISGSNPIFRTSGFAGGSKPRWQWTSATRLSTSANVTLTTFTIVVVARPSALGMFWSHPTSNNNYAYNSNSGLGAAYTTKIQRTGVYRRDFATPSWGVNQTGVFATHYTSIVSASGLAQYFNAKTPLAQTTNSDTESSVGSTVGNLNICCDGFSNGSFSMPGDFGEFLAYSPALTTPNLNTLLAYCGAKWGIAIGP